MPKSFYRLGEIINDNPGLASLRKTLKQSEVVEFFPEIFPEFKKVVSAVRVEKKTLFLTSESSAWKSELKFQEQLIIEKVNKYFKEERIKWIRFV